MGIIFSLIHRSTNRLKMKTTIVMCFVMLAGVGAVQSTTALLDPLESMSEEHAPNEFDYEAETGKVNSLHLEPGRFRRATLLVTCVTYKYRVRDAETCRLLCKGIYYSIYVFGYPQCDCCK